MKPKFHKLALLFLSFCIPIIAVSQVTITNSFNAASVDYPSQNTTLTGSVTIPSCIKIVTVECWGAGGGGGGAESTSISGDGVAGDGGGGGGGGYSTATISNAGTYTYSVGAGGLGGSIFTTTLWKGNAGGNTKCTNGSGAVIVNANGGGGGGFGFSSGGSAGSAGTGTTHNGGEGYKGNFGCSVFGIITNILCNTGAGGGGGGGAGMTGNGASATNATGGAAGSGGGGGAGASAPTSTNTNGNPGTGTGTMWGGGGSGAFSKSNVLALSEGGSGGNGQIIFIYYMDTPIITSFSPTSYCGTPSSDLVITGCGLTDIAGNNLVTAITINGTAVSSYTVNSASQITIPYTYLSGLSSGYIAVTTKYGTTTIGTGSTSANSSPYQTIYFNPNPTAYAGADTTVNITTSVVLGDTLPVGGTPPYTYQWSPSSGLSNTTISYPVATPMITTIYSLLVTDSNGCTGLDTVTVFFNNEDNPITSIAYNAQNVQYTSSGGQNFIEFDVFASDTPVGLLYSQSEIFIQYDSAIFGTYLVTNNDIVASKGQAVDSPYYNLAISDSTSTILKIAITHTPNPSSLTNLDSVNQQLCHLKINITTLNPTTIPLIFDTLAMTGKSEYQRSATSFTAPYDIVTVSGLAGVLRSATDTIIYQLMLDTITPAYYAGPPINNYVHGAIVFDIYAFASDGYSLYDADPIISYNPAAFGRRVCTSGNLTCTTTATSSYNFLLPTDITSTAFQLHLDADDPGNYDIINYPDSTIGLGYDVIATCTLNIQNCCVGSLDLAVNALSTGWYAYEDYTDSTTQYGQYGVTAGAGISTSTTCDNTTGPVITSFSPAGIPAGTFDTLTINGFGFGCSVGRVYFPNANDLSGVTSSQAQPPDFISWNDGQIQMIVASCQDGYTDGYTPGTGTFIVYPSVGNGSGSPTPLVIPYAVLNDRLPSLRAIRVGLSGADSGAFGGSLHAKEYTFISDVTITNNPPALVTITQAMNDWVCETGVRFLMGTPVDTNLSPFRTDYTNSILFSNIFGNNSGDVPGAETIVTAHAPCTNPSGDTVEVIADIDIVFQQSFLPFNATYQWELDTTCTFPDTLHPTLGYYSLLSDARHEFGHAHGLRHVLNPIDLMYPNIDEDECKVIHTDDVNGALYELLSVGSYMGPCFTPNIQYSRSLPACSGSTTGIQDVVNNYSIQAFPNPFDQTITINADIGTQSEVKIELITMLGQIVVSDGYGMVSDTQFQKTISTAGLSDGVYLLRVSINSSARVFKLVKN